ncbi:hypothetical protein MRX96_013771 [Rhipicephalus microplus]
MFPVTMYADGIACIRLMTANNKRHWCPENKDCTIYVRVMIMVAKRYWCDENEDGMIRVRLLTTDAKRHWCYVNEDDMIRVRLITTYGQTSLVSREWSRHNPRTPHDHGCQTSLVSRE